MDDNDGQLIHGKQLVIPLFWMITICPHLPPSLRKRLSGPDAERPCRAPPAAPPQRKWGGPQMG